MRSDADEPKTIHLRAGTRRQLNAFRSALGMTQDSCVSWLLQQQMREGETAWQAGDRLFKEWENKQQEDYKKKMLEDIPL